MPAAFTNLPVRNGFGPVHVNYFRTFIRPRRGAVLPTGDNLIALMPRFMNPHTASVTVDGTHRWNGAATLLFRGVARIRPFVLLPVPGSPIPMPVPLPEGLEDHGIPENIRTMLTPQVHTDSVGLPIAPLPHAFTVQTLKREFETRDDEAIRRAVGERIDAQIGDGWAGKARQALEIAVPVLGLTRAAQRAISAWLGDFGVGVNQHHFLAGRRSFRMGTVGGLELRSAGTRDDDWVFETAAVERFSLRTFAHATNFGMGGAPRVVRPVWMEMGDNVAAQYGQRLGSIVVVQQQYGTIAAALQSAVYRDLATRHEALVPATIRNNG